MRPLNKLIATTKFIKPTVSLVISLAFLAGAAYAAPLTGNDSAEKRAPSNVALATDPSREGAMTPDTGAPATASPRESMDPHYCNHRKLIFGCSSLPLVCACYEINR